MALARNGIERMKDGRPIFKTEHYDALTTRGAIRLLRIFYGPFEETSIHCEFISGTVLDYDDRHDSTPPLNFEPYDALSWCWGTEEESAWISIRKNGTQYAKAVRPTLIAALRALRHSVYDRTIWIDAICIDQCNYEERNHQVEMMAEIYSKADCVRIWLGSRTESSNIAIRFIKMKFFDFSTLTTSVTTQKKVVSGWRC